MVYNKSIMEENNVHIYKSSYSFRGIPDQKDYANHIHNTYEILYFLQGNVQMIMGGNVYKMKKGDLFIAKPFTYHSVKVVDKYVPYERFVFNFSEDFIPKMSKEFFKNARDVYNIPSTHPIYGLMEEWKKICLDNEVSDIEETQKEIFRSVITLLSVFVDEKEIKPLKTNKVIERILEYIDQHPTEKITAQKLANEFFVSTSWIVHTFKSHLDISFMDYVNKKRILYAQFLINNGLSPTQAYEQCNYTDYSTFYRQYKKFIGSVPKNDKNNVTNRV